MNDVFVSNHAYLRMKERAGISRKAADLLSAKVYHEGIGSSDTTGSLYRYITYESEAYNHNGADVRIYGETVYCFLEQPNGVLLLTVFWIPNKLKNQALGIQRKNKIA